MATTGGLAVYVPDLADPYKVASLGAAANLPALPNMYSPLQGYRMPHGVKSSVYIPIYVSATTVVTTGLTISMLMAMDPIASNCDFTSGSKAYFGVTVTAITSGTTIPDDSAFASSTEDLAQTASLPTAAGRLVALAITSATANENSFAANGWGLLRVRRVGDNALDTNLGNIVLVGVAAVGT
jgi:hypothetical protein